MLKIEEILPVLSGEFVCVTDKETTAFKCSGDFEKAGLYTNHTVSSISVRDGKLTLELTPWRVPAADSNSEWAKKYKEKNGAEPSFF